MKIGILQTGHAPEAVIPERGDYNDLFTRFLAHEAVEFVNFPVVDGVFPDDIAATFQGWIITGSRCGVYENLPWMRQLIELIRVLYEGDNPMVGVCFGHQIIAQALGGHVEKFSGGWSIGEISYQRDDDNNNKNREQKLVAWHQDQVVRLPEQAEVIGRSDNCAYAMLRYGNKALSFQPHPEFSQSFFEGLYQARRDGLPASAIPKIIMPREENLDRAAIATEIHQFLNIT